MSESGEANPVQSEAVTELIPSGARFEGAVGFVGSARISGDVLGDVLARGELEIARGARVEGRVESDQLIVAGEIHGDVHVSGRLAVLTGGRVTGHVDTGTLRVEDGATIEGPCTIQSTSAAEADPSR